ncbi:MAG: antA/AntB antirepressor family protein [Prevotellaceae bacterium]|jgi:anti-repressor protein|nr:antA/AntB antirepressor family protein [Prevotellaceae bacterium]
METNIQILIPISEHNGKKAVSARLLHAFLENKKQFSDWIKHRIQKYDLVENVDYQSVSLIGETGGRSIEYALSIDCAKELAMVEGNAKGKQARQYFIACEQKLKEIAPQSYKEALLQLVAKIEENEKLQLANRKTSFLLEEKMQELDQSKEWMTIKRYAKEHRMNWRKINWRRLKAISHELGYDIKKIFDANYGEVNLYNKAVFDACFQK